MKKDYAEIHAKWMDTKPQHSLAKPWADLTKQERDNFECEVLAGTLPGVEAEPAETKAKTAKKGKADESADAS